MRRTRKWKFVAQEATRLASLGLNQKDIAARLGVNPSSVCRWIATGKLTTGRPKRVLPFIPAARPQPRAAADWANAVRDEYSFDSTDDQLVTIAGTALELALDPASSPQLALYAAGRFQALVRQLGLLARRQQPEVETPAETDSGVRPSRRLRVVVSRADPRTLLTGGKP